MPIQVTCSSCRGMFNAPESAAGKRAKCPTCGSVIQIPSADSEEVLVAEADPVPRFADDEFDVEPPAALPSDVAPTAASTGARKQCPMCGEMIAATAIKCRFCGEVLDRSLQGVIRGAGDRSDPGWGKVRTGLAMIYYSIITMFLMFIIIMFGAMAIGGMAGAGNDPPMPMILVMGVCGIVIFGAAIALLIGEVMCAFVPASSGARGFAIGAVVCMLLNFVVSGAGSATDNPAISGGSGLLGMIGNVLFLLFIRQSAYYLGNMELADSAMKFLIASVVIIVGFVATAVAAAIIGPIAAILGIVLLISMIVLFVWYMRLLRTLMTTIDTR